MWKFDRHMHTCLTWTCLRNTFYQVRFARLTCSRRATKKSSPTSVHLPLRGIVSFCSKMIVHVFTVTGYSGAKPVFSLVTKRPFSRCIDILHLPTPFSSDRSQQQSAPRLPTSRQLRGRWDLRFTDMFPAWTQGFGEFWNGINQPEFFAAWLAMFKSTRRPGCVWWHINWEDTHGGICLALHLCLFIV